MTSTSRKVALSKPDNRMTAMRPMPPRVAASAVSSSSANLVAPAETGAAWAPPTLTAVHAGHMPTLDNSRPRPDIGWLRRRQRDAYGIEFGRPFRGDRALIALFRVSNSEFETSLPCSAARGEAGFRLLTRTENRFRAPARRCASRPGRIDVDRDRLTSAERQFRHSVRKISSAKPVQLRGLTGFGGPSRMIGNRPTGHASVPNRRRAGPRHSAMG